MTFPVGRREDDLGRQLQDFAALIATKTGRLDNEPLYGLWTFWTMPVLAAAPVAGYVLKCADSAGTLVWASVASVLPADVMLTDSNQTITGEKTFDGTGVGAPIFAINAANTWTFATLHDADTGNDLVLLLGSAVAAAGNFLTFPSTGGTVMTLTAVQNVLGKTFTGTTIINAAASNVIKTNTSGPLLQDNSTSTKTAGFNLAGQSANTKTTFATTATVNRTVTFPDATDTLVGKATTDTLTNKTLTSPVLDTGTVLQATSSSVGAAFQDTGVSSKKARIVTTSGSGNQALDLQSTARTFVFPETGGATNQMAVRIGKDDKTGQTGSVGTVTLATTPAAGWYRINVYAVATTGVAASTLVLTTGWTDEQQAQSESSGAAAIAVTGSYTKLSSIVYAASGAALTYATTEVGTATYAVHGEVVML